MVVLGDGEGPQALEVEAHAAPSLFSPKSAGTGGPQMYSESSPGQSRGTHAQSSGITSRS